MVLDYHTISIEMKRSAAKKSPVLVPFRLIQFAEAKFPNREIIYSAYNEGNVIYWFSRSKHMMQATIEDGKIILVQALYNEKSRKF